MGGPGHLSGVGIVWFPRIPADQIRCPNLGRRTPILTIRGNHPLRQGGAYLTRRGGRVVW